MSEQNTLNLEETGDVDSVEKYKFDPIKGYPMLHWHGKRPFTTTQYYPAQKKEVYGEEVDGWINKIFWGDNLQVMSHLLKEFRGKVDLIYIDPPFDSKADYKKKIKIKVGAIKNDSSSFEEKQYSDIWNNDEYLQFIYERLILIRELLSDTGSIFVHCDWHVSHHMRCIMDEVFGPNNFINELVWKRTTAHGDAKQGAKKFDIVHDDIFFYSKTSGFKWNVQYVPFGKEQIKAQYNKTDDDGRKYRLVTPTAAKPGGDTSYEFHGVNPPAGRYWAYSKKKMEEMYEQGKMYFSSTGQPYIKYYLDERPGVAASTLWMEIPILSPTAKERLDYPTQKPEALIERIIKCATDSGDLVFDCFMGSGTTQAVAMKLGRCFVGADINYGSIQTTIKRLINISQQLKSDSEPDGETKYTGFEVSNVNNYDVFRNPVEAKGLLLEALEIEALTGTIYDGRKDDYMVKVMPVNRLATREDLNELISGFPYKVFEQRKEENPSKPVESIMLICMGHEPDLKAHLEQECGYKLDVEVVDILRDKSHIEFKRDAEAAITVDTDNLEIVSFFPMNLLQKLSLQKESVSEWRDLVESVVIDWNYGGAAMEPTVVDVPSKDKFVKGVYEIPDDAGTIKIKITDLLSESYEEVIKYG